MTDGPSIAELRAAYESMGFDPAPLGDDRAKHMAWCKERALLEIDSGNPQYAWASMVSDLSKHPETKDHPGIQLGFMLLMTDNLPESEMRTFIEGFC